MSRDEAYEAAIDELTDLVDRIETFYTTPMTDEAIAIRARAIVDAALMGAGIDPDKTYYERGKDHTPRCNITILGFSPMEEEGGCTCEPIDVWVRVGEDTENES